MAKSNLIHRINKVKDWWLSPIVTKSFIPTSQTTLRNRPFEGFTDNMLRHILSTLTTDANFINLQSDFDLMIAYMTNPVVNAVINIKADAWSNMRYEIRDLNNDEIIPLEKYTADGGKLKRLLVNPNPRESGFEWRKTDKVNHEVFGNSYNYASVPVGLEKLFTYQDINALNNIPKTNLKAIITGKWLEATDINEIIEKYIFTNINGTERDLNTNQIWHTNVTNIKLNEHFTDGISKLVALQAPISNIAAAYDTRNVMLNNRGPLGFLSSEKIADGLGSIALDPKEKQQVQDAMNDYGTKRGQFKHIISPMPMKYVKMSGSVKDMMVFEEVESDSIAVGNGFGVPVELIKYHIAGSTFENVATSERRLYDSTIIPESKDHMLGMNTFFKTQDFDIEILASFDHVAALQTNKKDEATTNKLNAETKLEAFMAGAITYNVYLASLNEPNDDKFGEKRIWDLKPEQLSAIGVNNKTTSNGTENN